MIPHLQIDGRWLFQAVLDSEVVTGFLAIGQDGTARFRGGTPWAPTAAPDAIEIAGAQLRQRYKEQTDGSTGAARLDTGPVQDTGGSGTVGATGVCDADGDSGERA